jgi:hypothetical protein
VARSHQVAILLERGSPLQQVARSIGRLPDADDNHKFDKVIQKLGLFISLAEILEIEETAQSATT